VVSGGPAMPVRSKYVPFLRIDTRKVKQSEIYLHRCQTNLAIYGGYPLFFGLLA
jgi:hypothetical protein